MKIDNLWYSIKAPHLVQLFGSCFRVGPKLQQTAGGACCLATSFNRLWQRAWQRESWFCGGAMKNTFQAGTCHLKIPSDIIEKSPQRSSAGSCFLWLMFWLLGFATCPMWHPGLHGCKMLKDLEKNALNGVFFQLSFSFWDFFGLLLDFIGAVFSHCGH